MTAKVRRAEASEPDLASIAAIVNAVTPDSPTSVEDLRHEDDVYPGSVRFLAEVDGTVVGTAKIGRIYMLPPDYDALWASVLVLPEARRRGIGSALLQSIADVARDRGKSALHGAASEERPEGIEFLLHRGFHERARSKMVRLELAGRTAPDVAMPEAFELTSLAARPDLIDGVHAVAVEAFADIPSNDRPPVAGDLAEFRARDVDWPTIPHEAFMIAVDRATGAVAGYASLVFPAGTERFASHDMTAIGRAWRGLGIASALKRATIAWAIDHELEHLDTGNDAENDRMRAVNARLGYRPLPDELSMRGLVADIPRVDD